MVVDAVDEQHVRRAVVAPVQIVQAQALREVAVRSGIVALEHVRNLLPPTVPNQTPEYDLKPIRATKKKSWRYLLTRVLPEVTYVAKTSRLPHHFGAFLEPDAATELRDPSP